MVDTNYSRGDIILKPDGTKITRASIMADAISYYQQQYQNGLTDICDFSEGSEIRTLHESFVVELFSLYKEMFRTAKMKFILDASGTYLDRLGCEFHVNRKTAKQARGSVTFEITESFREKVTIPAGTTILSHDEGHEYVLMENVTITGTGPTNGTVVSRFAGARYNAAPGKLTAFQDVHSIRRAVSVTNNGAIVGGKDAETDEEFRERILNAKKEKSWGTKSVYNNQIVNNVTGTAVVTEDGTTGSSVGVHDVQFVEPEELLLDPTLPPHYKAGTNWSKIEKQEWSVRKKYYCTDCTCVLFVNGNMKPCSEELLEAVEYYITQENNLVIGHLFHVQSAEVVYVYLGMELYLTASVSEETIYMHLLAYFDGYTVETKYGNTTYQGVNISEKVSKGTLLDVLESIPGVNQVGSLHVLKYNPDLTQTNTAWVDNYDNTYSYTDDEGYTFTRGTRTEDVVNPWGWSNFDTLECGLGQVLTVGSMKKADSDRKTIFDITSTIIS